MKRISQSKSRIGVIGAGPAGLSAAYFLKKQGFTNIQIFEKNPQVGGKCISKTVDGKSFDIGANYVPSSYKIVRKLARELGAKLYTEGPVQSYDHRLREFRSVFRAVLSETTFFRLFWHSLKYMWLRWRLNKVISSKTPGYAGIADSYPELCQPFETWLEDNNMADLSLLFEAPVTLMGYSQLTKIPTAYVLTYLPVATFCEVIGASISTRILGYPKRFIDGFQRFFEKLSWTLETEAIHFNTRVTKVTRDETIQVDYISYDPDSGKEIAGSAGFDFLFVGAPLHSSSLHFMDFEPSEKALFEKVFYDPFAITTYRMPDTEKYYAGTFSLPEPKMYTPFVVNRQFKNTDLIAFYTRSPVGEPTNKNEVLTGNENFVRESLGLELCPAYTYNSFDYFPHVTSKVMASRFYDDLEALQGKKNTFYVGGLLNFELVETIMNYSKHLVAKHFDNL